MEQVLNNSGNICCSTQLNKSFFESCKLKENFQVGIEFEKIGVNKNTFQYASYYGQKGINAFLRELRNDQKLNEIYEGKNLIGLEGDTGTVTLEPGSQVEYSSIPCKSLQDIEKKVALYNQKTAEIAEKFNIEWMGYGIQPLSTFDNINIIPKKRYEIMTKYLPTKGDMPLVMMRETAGIQTAVDYDSEEDAIKKLKVSLGILPIITAMMANSPIRGGKFTGYKSYRAYGWLKTDEDRCGLIDRKVFESGFTFDDYINVLLDVPMFFIEKNGILIDTTHLTFRQYLDKGFDGHRATFKDWALHMTTFFPDIRLKSYIEVRNCDCQRSDLIMTLPALMKGLMYNQDAMEHAWGLVKDLTWEERQKLRLEVPGSGLDTKVKNHKVLDLAKELVNIAEYSLKTSSDISGEEVYLERIKELLSDGVSPADIIIKNWESGWNRDLSKLVEYSKIS